MLIFVRARQTTFVLEIFIVRKFITELVFFFILCYRAFDYCLNAFFPTSWPIR